MNDLFHPILASTAIERVDAPPPAVYLHCAIFLSEQRVLKAETFRLVNFKGQEQVSEHFDFQLELHGNTDYSQAPLRFEQLMGSPVSFAIQLPVDGRIADDPGWADERFDKALTGKPVDGLSLFNGVIAGMAMEIPAVYRLTVKPSLWRLTLTNHYRILSQMSIAKAIATVLEEHGVAYDMAAIQSGDNLASSRVQSWLQAGESDYDFVRRLMGKAHLYYYYRHSGDAHIVVFDNHPDYLKLPLAGPLRYTYSAIDELGLAQQDVIAQYSFRQNLVSSGVRSVFAHTQESWETERIPRYALYQDKTPGDNGTLPFRLNKLYQYGGSKIEVGEHTKAAAQALAAGGTQFSGSAFCPLFRAGYQFQVTEEVMAEMAPMPVCPSLDQQWFVLTQVQHQASLDGSYSNQFEATSAHTLITPFSIQETQQGVVLGKVVGHVAPSDWKYYAKDNFDLKEMQLQDSNAEEKNFYAKGVLVQFATDGAEASPAGGVWVKLAAHMQGVPEIGVTVLVSRANDESELPEIQSIIHNNGNKVVVPDGQWTANTNVGNNHSTSYGDSKSIRYGFKSQVDLDRAIGIVTQAYASGEYRDTSYSQGGSYGYSTSENGKDGLLSRSDSYGSTYSTHHGAMSQSETVFDNIDSKSTVTGLAKSVSNNNQVENTSTTNTQNSTSTVTSSTSKDTIGSSSNTSTIGSSSSNQSIGQSSSTSTIGKSSNTSTVGSSSNTSIDGESTQMSITGMRSSTAILGSGTDVSITGSSTSVSAAGMRTSSDAVGVSTTSSMTGVSSHTGMTGVSAQTSLTGASTSMSLTGSSSGMNIVGSTNDMSVIGSTSRMNVVGSSSDISVTGSADSVSVIGSHSDIKVIGSGISISVASPQTEISMKLTGINLVTSIEITM
jgi:type VI secretion system secreted protein VgrG